MQLYKAAVTTPRKSVSVMAERNYVTQMTKALIGLVLEQTLIHIIFQAFFRLGNLLFKLLPHTMDTLYF